jgi:hypothetical protein
MEYYPLKLDILAMGFRAGLFWSSVSFCGNGKLPPSFGSEQTEERKGKGLAWHFYNFCDRSGTPYELYT